MTAASTIIDQETTINAQRALIEQLREEKARYRKALVEIAALATGNVEAMLYCPDALDDISDIARRAIKPEKRMIG